ncbi:hybrid sensor histidine kinase/response regulator [Ottowia testudinis]|uniref:Chemotaxis protein CheA n=1 Tax=Ottowia testudinis TaxID=2816950 RepID=A0A975CJF5_9BURK|nr:Hpt domain-containing protein [Ottowia testudinis]QTD46196.1 Hpt domain-containing protein [Ottowia testudinis]
MVTSHQAENRAQGAPAGGDLGPLAWVLDETRKSIEAATKSLKRFAHDAEAARGVDLASVDASQLRLARQQLHQVMGALDMVGQLVPAQMVRGMEGAVQQFVLHPDKCNEQAAQTLERAGFALIEYLESQLGDRPRSAMGLFPLFKQVQEMAGADRIHPADMWVYSWRWVDPATPAAAQPLGYTAEVRSRLDQRVLKIMKHGDINAASELSVISLGLAQGETARQPVIFWKLSAGFFEGLAKALVPMDVYAKRAASRILLQYTSLARGDQSVSERLAQDLLFFCARAQAKLGAAAPILGAVRKAWSLDRYSAAPYDVSTFGLYDPAVLAQARRRVEAVKENWSALAGGDMARTKACVDQFGLVAESLEKLHGSDQSLAKALNQVSQQTAQSGKPPTPELAMETATAVLFLEASFADFQPSDATFAARLQQLAERLNAVRAGASAPPLESWMEDLYRSVSDRQTLGTVVGELRATLGEAEQHLDQFFRNPADKNVLAPVPSLLGQMRGVLSVLGLDQAALAVGRMRDTVDELLVVDIDPEQVKAAGTFDKLGNSLGALGFQIDMLGYQPLLARKLFVYDAEAGELKHVTGRVGHDEHVAEPTTGFGDVIDLALDLEQESAAPRAALAVSLDDTQPPDTFPGQLDQIAATAALEDRPALAGAAHRAAEAARQHDEADLSGALKELHVVAGAPAVPPTPVPAPVSGVDDLSEDDDLLDIFLEEAREVVQTGGNALDGLAAAPADLEQQTTLRRAFHTLKGSSRMVGLTEFGEAAWSMEQLLNAWLAEQKPVTDDLRTLASEAMLGFGAWIEDIAARSDGGWSSAPFRASADALRLEGRRVVLRLERAAEVESHDVETVTVSVSDAAPEVKDPMGVGVDHPAVSDAQGESQPSAAFELPDLELSMPSAEVSAEVQATAPVLVDQPADMLTLDLADFAAAEALPIAEATELDAAELEAAFDLPSSASPIGDGQRAQASFSSHQPGPDSAAQAHDSAALVDLGLQAQPAPLAEPESPLLALELPELDFTAAPEAAPASPINAALTEQLLVATHDDAGEATVDSRGFELLAAGAVPEPPVVTERAEAVDDVLALDLNELDFATRQEPPTSGAPVEDIGTGLDAVLSDDDQYKQIGELRISAPLYNVYLNEADEWSRQLITELSEWALELDHPVPERAIARAHSLAGSSATVGFSALSDLARAIEHALERLHGQMRGTSDQARVLGDAAEDVRRLLHQFAAGMLKTPNPDVVAAVQALEPVELADGESEEAAVEVTQEPVQVPAFEAPLVVEQVAAVEQAPTPEQAPMPGQATPVAQHYEDAPRMQPPVAPTVTVTDLDIHASSALGDDIDVTDAVDPDLFPIFEEEAEELLPQLGTALRQWVAHPDDRGPRSQVLRALHTLKGSARLAGALRLGEMAHRTESAIETIGTENIGASDLEPLMDYLDELEAGFRRLQGVEPVAQEVPVTPPPPPRVLPVMPPPVAVALAPAAPVADVPAVQAVADAPRVQSVSPAGRGEVALPAALSLVSARASASQAVRVRSQLLDRLVTQAGEVVTSRARLESEIGQLRGSLNDLTGNLERLRLQLRDVELQAETQMQSRLALSKDAQQNFDPLEFDRFTRMQELTRIMAESVNDVATVQRSLQRAVEASEDDLAAQARQSRELQRDLLRTRMVEFEGISERLYRVVRQASKETGKQVRLDITGGSIEMDRGILDRMTPAFEHLLRNCVVHGIETQAVRAARSKDPAGLITIDVQQSGNDVSVEFRDDGGGLNLPRIRERALQQGLITPDQAVSDSDIANMVFASGFSTATEVTELAGRGVGMDVVRTEVQALGGRIETQTRDGLGASFRLVLPLTTAVTHVVMLRCGNLSVGVPSNLVEIVQRTPSKELEKAYEAGFYRFDDQVLPFFWSGALLQSSPRSTEPPARATPVVILRSAEQRVAIHVDEVLGNQEVVVKALGPQLSRLPGLVAITALASGAVALIYNPVALAAVYGDQARAMSVQVPLAQVESAAGAPGTPAPIAVAPQSDIPLVLVVDDSITVRRVTQRLLQREGYRVALAADGLQGLERLQGERPTVVLSDIEMPRMDGFDFVRNIRADERLRDLPVIMITSRIAEKHREHARELGVDHYLGKPYSEEELLGLIKDYARANAAAGAV